MEEIVIEGYIATDKCSNGVYFYPHKPELEEASYWVSSDEDEVMLDLTDLVSPIPGSVEKPIKVKISINLTISQEDESNKTESTELLL